MSKRNNKATSGQLAGAEAIKDFPNFDENALNALTERIEKGLDKTQSKSSKDKDKSSSGKSPQTHKEDKSGKVADKKEGNNSHGKKRDARGNVKDEKKGSKKSKDAALSDDRAQLLEEILALGGTEDDLDLVADAFSDEEEEPEKGTTKASDKTFMKDLAQFAAGLGIESQVVDESSDEADDEDVEEQEDQYWEDGSNTDALDEEVQALPTPVVAQKATLSKVPELTKPKDVSRLVFEARPDWHAAELPPLPVPDALEAVPNRAMVDALKKYATSLLEADAALYASKNLSSTSSHRFLSTIMSSGTLSDKVSALTLVVQESPVHTTKSFEALLALAKKRSRGQAVTALGAMKDLLGVGVVLPADRRLRAFTNQPGLLGTLEEHTSFSWREGDPLPGAITKAHLISWAYEDWLKDIYFEMLKVLEGWCSDEVEYARGRAVTYVYELLKEKPEQESNLLRLLVNKLGDPDKKIASRTSYLMLQLQTTHPLMKPIIVKSIETELLLRPGQSSHAKYYAINTLNQTILSGKEEDVARKLLSIYFGLFVSLLKKPEAPKAPAGPVMNKKGQVQGGGGQKGKKAMQKATKEEEAKQASEETTEKMISAVLTGVNRAFPFAQTDDATLEQHMDTLFRITHSSNFNTSIQALMLIQQLASLKNLAQERFYRTLYESLLDPRLLNSSKHALYLNLLYRALKADLNVKRVKAFSKRLLQIITLHQPPFVCGVLYLLRELETTFPSLKTLLAEPEEGDEEDEEVFRDVPEDDVAEIPALDDQMHPDRKAAPVKSTSYDGRKRDPEHSNADKSCLWEALPFLVHFHPSVSMFATRLLNGTEMPAKPDLASHTLIHFLDRFVYRNAKASAGGPRGTSIMQPLAGGDSRGVLVSNRLSGKSQDPVNSEAFWRKKAEDVAVDEVFFHKYFSQIGKGKQNQKKASEKKPSNEEDEDEDENEDEIWQALVDSRPEVEGNSDDDSDLDMLDLDDSDNEDAESAGSGDEGVDFELDDDEVASDASGDRDTDLFDEDEDDLVDSDDEEAAFNQELETAKPAEEEVKEESASKKRRKMMKSLPTFASADDYAAMMVDDDADQGA